MIITGSCIKSNNCTYQKIPTDNQKSVGIYTSPQQAALFILLLNNYFSGPDSINPTQLQEINPGSKVPCREYC